MTQITQFTQSSTKLLRCVTHTYTLKAEGLTYYTHTLVDRLLATKVSFFVVFTNLNKKQTNTNSL